MYARVTILVLILASVHTVLSFDSRSIVFVIVSQAEPHHASLAHKLKKDIEKQVLQLEDRRPNVHLTHEDFPVPGAWTILPLLGPLAVTYEGTDARWVVFLEDLTAVRCDMLIDVLAAADKQKDTMWMGYPLRDEEPTIIHHFSIYEELQDEGGFVYPHFATSFVMRMELVRMLVAGIVSGSLHLEADFSIDPAYELISNKTTGRLVAGIESGSLHLEADFSIDPAYELAQLVRRAAGAALAAAPAFCLRPAAGCAAHPTELRPCGRAVRERDILFAVKTWSGYHATRAHVVKQTWGKRVSNLVFFSDKDDPSLPAISTGVPNTPSGHCEKTVRILQMAVRMARDKPHIQWIFLADDDTILGVRRLCEVLSCYRGGDDVTILGERYGYGYGKKETADKGYDYITGGGGTALSLRAAVALARCACAAPRAPDDMTLGACARALGAAALVHLPLFHQARPQDYSRSVLAGQRPVSFHRPGAEPSRLYAAWFLQDDLTLHKDEL